MISWLTVIFLGGLAPFNVKINWKFTKKWFPTTEMASRYVLVLKRAEILLREQTPAAGERHPHLRRRKRSRLKWRGFASLPWRRQGVDTGDFRWEVKKRVWITKRREEGDDELNSELLWMSIIGRAYHFGEMLLCQLSLNHSNWRKHGVSRKRIMSSLRRKCQKRC